MTIVNNIIYEALENINLERIDKDPIEISEATRLFGEKGELDSLELVSLVVDVEERVEDEFGTMLSLTNEAVLNQNPSPFSSVKALSAYITNTLETKN